MDKLISAEKFIRWLDVGHYRPPTELCYSENDVVKMIDMQPTAEASPVVRSMWKYNHKKRKATCQNCSFERDLDADFGRAISCPNCGADMGE